MPDETLHSTPLRNSAILGPINFGICTCILEKSLNNLEISSTLESNKLYHRRPNDLPQTLGLTTYMTPRDDSQYVLVDPSKQLLVMNMSFIKQHIIWRYKASCTY